MDAPKKFPYSKLVAHIQHTTNQSALHITQLTSSETDSKDLHESGKIAWLYFLSHYSDHIKLYSDPVPNHLFSTAQKLVASDGT